MEQNHSLNERQEAVASATSGRVVVLAGPGSGKTATLVERIRRIIDEGVEPAQIVACTFTVRAATELEERLGSGLGFCGTIHGFAREILRLFPDAHPLGGDFSILDEEDVTDLYKHAHAELHLKTSVSKCKRRIRGLATRGGDPEALPVEDSPEGLDARRLEVGYRAICARLRATDFDGLIRHARRLLLSDPMVRASVRSRWHHLSVDEAQDLDEAQADFLALVAPGESVVPGAWGSTLFVGDPLQSIYSWRGGTPQILLDLAETAHTRVMLGHNFRSKKTIVTLANEIAAEDPLRPPEYELLPMRDGTDRDVWTCAPFPSDDEELGAIVGMIQRASLGGVRFREIAVLGRTNALLEALAERLAAGGVPFQHLGQRKARLNSPTCRGAIAYLRAALNPADDLAVMRALECPPRPALLAWKDFVPALRRASAGGCFFDALKAAAPWAPPDCFDEIESFVGMLEEMHEAGSWVSGVDALWSFLQIGHRALGLEARAEDIAWMRTLLAGFHGERLPGSKRAKKTLAGFLWWLSHGQGAGEHDPDADAVTLSTIHLAKGLEWPTVFVPGLVERVFPSAPSCNAEAAGNAAAVDEERRCFFVAATRARDRLVLTRCAAMRDVRDGLLYPAEPSRFLRFPTTRLPEQSEEA